jgi:NTE family protein
MKKFLLFCLFTTLLLANDKPKIALVLSGGGARGGAHVGVLKILEENRVPIDMIVGTSMGSFVGGLYASGMSPEEIEKMLITTDWRKYIRSTFDRQDMPMRRKNIDYTYQGRLGLGINAQNELVLPTGVFKRKPMLLKFMQLTENVSDIQDFDKLSIPYRAVATNIENGETVVLKSGSLAKAMYASSSIPGGFQPINIDGIDLVDGGVSDNIPINVARKMGADIIIAVDVSENFDENLDVNSYLVVMGQLVNILMRKNANKSIATLRDQDILITPNLKGFSGLDADKYRAIIQRGEELDVEVIKRLQKLSVDEKEYLKYVKKYRKQHLDDALIIDSIEIENPTYFSNESIRRRVHQKIGEKLDKELLRADLLHIYDMTIFDSVDYKLQKVDGKNTLLIETTPSWDNHGEIRFALGIEDDFQGHSAYSLKLGYTMFGINALGGEWRSDFEIGRRKKAYTEFFQPLDTMQRYYLRPYLSYEEVTDIFVVGGYSNQELYSGRKGGGMAIGAHVGTNYEFEFGISSFNDFVEVDSLHIDQEYFAAPLYALINIDNLDDVNFPKVGVKSELKWTKELPGLGSDYSYEQVSFEIEKPFTFYANNITGYFEYGQTYKDDGVDRLAGTYTLGGLFNLSGYAPYSFNDQNVFLGVLKYTYEIKDGGFFGSLNAPLYAGFSLEAGETWGRYNKFGNANLKESGTVYLAADTLLGPFYLAYGFSADGQNSAYLYLGEKF